VVSARLETPWCLCSLGTTRFSTAAQNQSPFYCTLIADVDNDPQFSKMLNYLKLERAKVVSFAVFVVGWTCVVSFCFCFVLFFGWLRRGWEEEFLSRVADRSSQLGLARFLLFAPSPSSFYLAISRRRIQLTVSHCRYFRHYISICILWSLQYEFHLVPCVFSFGFSRFVSILLCFNLPLLFISTFPPKPIKTCVCEGNTAPFPYISFYLIQSHTPSSHYLTFFVSIRTIASLRLARLLLVLASPILLPFSSSPSSLPLLSRRITQ
jgi:hypothetical protein